MDKLKVFLPILLVIAAGTYGAFMLYPDVHPLGGIKLDITPDETTAKAQSIGSELGTTTEGYWEGPKFMSSTSLLQQLQHEAGLERANELTRGSVPAYYWSLRWRKQPPSYFNTSESNEGEEVQVNSDLTRSGNVRFSFDTHGNLIGYRQTISDTARIPSLGAEDAHALAREFLTRYTVFREHANGDPRYQTITFFNQQRTERGQRQDFVFTWTTRYPELSNNVNVNVSVAGNTVSSLAIDYGVPKEYRDNNRETYVGLAIALLYIAIIVTMVILAFRRWRSGELGFRTATALGAACAVLSGIEIYGTLSKDIGWTMVFPLLFGPLFIGGGLLLAWAVSESVGREQWKEKFIPFDLLLNGYVLHSRVGFSLLRGIGIGVFAFFAWLGLVRAADATTTFAVSYQASHLDSIFPVFDALAPAFYGSLYNLALLVLFLLAFFTRRFRSAILAVALTAVLYGFAHAEKYSPLVAGLVIFSAIGGIFVYALYRYDTLTSLLSLTTFSLFSTGCSFLTVGNPAYFASGYVLFGLLGALVAVSGAALFTKDPVLDFQELAPSFARHITERQRLQQELEVARRVQMTFLPKKEPDFPGLNIACRCAPALEVGGDYYDFIHLDGRKLGIAIGDVSGKGTQAAFYMTLTKGFLRALARLSDSPAKVLTEANKLFYDNVERGAFISMVYGIFDAEKRVLTLARAGHNPVIMRKPRRGELQSDGVEVIHPSGLALGLEPGEAFARTIQEVHIPYQPGDVFVFYTDGFPEAMNNKQEEFGENRLCEVIHRHSSLSAEGVMESVFKEMKSFVGKAKQHDDMTIVVVKTT